MKSYEYNGITYNTPSVYLLDNTHMLFAEFFARTAYDSFDKSEHEILLELKQAIDNGVDISNILTRIKIKDDTSSELLNQLSHVYFHESTLEHIYFNFYVSGISRALLQELARHRIASYTVKSTRYTMTKLLHNYLVGVKFATSIEDELNSFIEYVLNTDGLFVVPDSGYLKLEAIAMFHKLSFQKDNLGYEEFRNLIVPKSLLDAFENATDKEEALGILKSKSKRNIGDSFKHIVSENISVDVGLSINLRSLKNMFDLRLNGSAWFQFQVLMNELFKVVPENYMSLINSGKLNGIQEGIQARLADGGF